MLQLGFTSRWVQLISKCIRSIFIWFFFYSELIEPIFSSRGLRQGDPLSPYFVILCAKGLSALLRDSKKKGLLRDI